MSGPADSFERLAGNLALLFARPGYPFEHEDLPSLHEHFFELLQSGQWVMIAQSGRLIGWQGWYRVPADFLAQMRMAPLGKLLAEYRAVHGAHSMSLREGDCCYIANTVVAPWAPRSAYRALYSLTVERNPDAVAFAAHITSRDRPQRWWYMSKQRVGICQADSQIA